MNMTHMPSFLVLLLLLLCNAHGLVANNTNTSFFISKYAFLGRHTLSMPLSESETMGMGTASPVPNLFEHGLLKAMNGSGMESGAPSLVVASANGSSFFPVGLPYFVSMTQKDYSYMKVLSSLNCDNGRNIALPYAISHDNSSNKNGQKEALRQNKLNIYEQVFDVVVGHAITTTNRLNYSDSIYQFTGSGDSDSLEDNSKSNTNLITGELLRFIIVHLTCLAILKLLTTIFTWILEHKRIIDYQDVQLVIAYSEFIVTLMLLIVTILVMSNTRSLNSMLTIEKLQPGAKDVRTELSVFHDSRTGISKESMEKNNSWQGDDLERFAESEATARREKTNKKWGAFIKLNHNFKSKNLISLSSYLDVLKWVMATFPYRVSGEISSNENHKDVQGYYDELIYQLYNKVNGSVSFEELTLLVVEHRRSAVIAKDEMADVKLRILVPTGNAFHEFVNVYHDPEGNRMFVTGYSVEVFKEVMASLPYRVSYEFFSYENGHSNDMGYYDELIHLLHLNRYDGIVGDVTITANRSKYGDFTQPYLMSGVSMIVPIEDNDITKSIWWFLKPFTFKLWVTIIALFLSKGILVWIFEYGNPEFGVTFTEQLGKILSFSFSIFVFAQKEELKSNYSRWVVNLWIFAVFVLVTTYASILQSMLTSNNVQPVVTSIECLITNGDYVGYQKGSFVFETLKHMGFQEEKLKAYSSKEEYAIALSRGSHNNGVSAIFDEIPYIKVFLAKYGHRYAMVGPTFRPGGFGFVFQRGCAIVPDISRAVLRLIEGEKMGELEKKWFGSHKTIPHQLLTPETNMKLSTYGFRGLLLITEPVSGVALLVFVIVFIFKWRKTSYDPSSRTTVVASDIEMAEHSKDEVSHVDNGENDQGTPNDSSPLEVGADCNHSEKAFQNKSCNGDKMEEVLLPIAIGSGDEMEEVLPTAIGYAAQEIAIAIARCHSGIQPMFQ